MLYITGHVLEGAQDYQTMTTYQMTGSREEGYNMSVVQYEEDKINRALLLLGKIPVQGPQQVSAMGVVYDILAHPIPEEVVPHTKE